MDVFDQAQERIEQEENLRRQAFKPVEIPQGTGFCQLEGCGEPVKHGGRWCDSFCRDLWQAEQKQRR